MALEDLNHRVRKAIQLYWLTLETQGQSQGGSGVDARDRGRRSQATGGKQMDGFVNLVTELLTDVGLPSNAIHRDTRLELPGYYRSTKKWDLIVILDGRLLATVEFKSIASSYGNNLNNRTEESLGSAEDYWTAYRDGAFGDSPRPWLGYLMLIGDSPRANTPVRVFEPHFKVFGEFRGASYVKRAEILLTKLVREPQYDATCLLKSPATAAETGQYEEPSYELSFNNFAASLVSKVQSYLKTR